MLVEIIQGPVISIFIVCLVWLQSAASEVESKISQMQPSMF